MGRELRSLRACLDELRRLVQSSANGTFYLAGSDNEIAAIALCGGVVAAVNYRGNRGDAAVDLIRGLSSASTSFHTGPARSLRQSQLSDSSIDWLSGADDVEAEGHVVAHSTLPGAAVPATMPGLCVISGEQRKTVETIAMSYLGPVAASVCDAAFYDFDEIGPVIDEIAGLLPPHEAVRFRGEVAKAIGRPV